MTAGLEALKRLARRRCAERGHRLGHFGRNARDSWGARCIGWRLPGGRCIAMALVSPARLAAGGFGMGDSALRTTCPDGAVLSTAKVDEDEESAATGAEGE